MKRTTVVVVIVAALVLCLLAARLYTNYLRRDAVVQLESAGFDIQLIEGPPRTLGPGYLAQSFKTIRPEECRIWWSPRVNFLEHTAEDQPRVDDSLFFLVRRFPELETLFVSSPNSISAEGLRALATHNKLRELVIGTGVLKDEDLEYLSHLQSLEILGLSNQPISDEGMRRLSNLENIESLGLSGTRVDGSFLEGARYRDVICVLELADTRINDDTARRVLQLPKLKMVDLSHCSIGDDIIQEMKDKGIKVEQSSRRAEFIRSLRELEQGSRDQRVSSE